MMLYQYRGCVSSDDGFKYLSNLIANGEMKFSKSTEFNDPFDCCPSQLHEMPEGAIPNAVGDEINKSLQSIRSVIYGVACFTPRNNSMLMWSHYGDQHKGICVGFDHELLEGSPPRNSLGHPLYKKISQINYTNTRPNSKSADLLTQKSLEWAYEQEHRIISEMSAGTPSWGPGIWSIPKAAIKEIIFGARSSAETREKISSLIRLIAPEIQIKIAVPHIHSFELLIEDFDSQPKFPPSVGYVSGPDGKWHHT